MKPISLLTTGLAAFLLCSCATEPAVPPGVLAEVPINEGAGRGDLLTVPVRLADGEELPFLVDTGSGTVFDRSWEAKLGKPLGNSKLHSWGTETSVKVYAMPPLFLGGVPLQTPDRTVAYDLDSLDSRTGQPIRGMLGVDSLSHYCVQLDFAAGKLRILDDTRADKTAWGRAFPMVALNARDGRLAVAENLLGVQGPHSLIDSGFDSDGWLMPENFHQWTNRAGALPEGETHSPDGLFGGDTYRYVSLRCEKVESDGIGLRFLARHLVTLDYPNRTLYLRRQSAGPLPAPGLLAAGLADLSLLTAAVANGDANVAASELLRIGQSNDSKLAKTVARELVATLGHPSLPTPAEVPPETHEIPLGDTRPDSAQVGWLQPAANRIPPNGQVDSPVLDADGIYATGLFAHAPSRYVFDLGGQWKVLRGTAGLHTAFQSFAAGVTFVILADGREVFRSGAVRGAAQVRYQVDVTNVKELALAVEIAADRNDGNWALWLAPTLFR